MFRFLLVSLFLAKMALFAGADIFQEYKTQILSISDTEARIVDNENIVVGSSGIVMHRFDNETNTIIARGVVTKKDGAYATIRFKVFDALEQAAFPLPGILPQEGDTIILNYLYNRALIIAPNETVYNEITKHFSNISWIHPDITAGYLSKINKPNPSRETFKKICYQNSAGLVFIALDGDGYFADCVSFKIVKALKTGSIAFYQAPFYNRLAKIDSYIWDINSYDIKDYEYHYEGLLVE